ncbi:MAG TPA: DUF4097 family beta strand repeat-containing protein [Thermomicrobiales bacterium]|nr:DUF4097 family beta strand repeat-containing protein [Thermomicrobiales bacterium]
MTPFANEEPRDQTQADRPEEPARDEERAEQPAPAETHEAQAAQAAPEPGATPTAATPGAPEAAREAAALQSPEAPREPEEPAMPAVAQAPRAPEPPVPPTAPAAPEPPPAPPAPPAPRHEEPRVTTTPSGARRFAVAGRGAPRLSITNIGGWIRVRGADDDRDGITVRAINRDGETVALDEIAEVQYTPEGEFTVRVQPLANFSRQFRRVRDAFNFNRANFFDNVGELVETVSAIGREWTSVNFEATVPRRCDLYLATASGEIAVADVEGTLHLRAASGEISGHRLGGNLVAQTASGEIAVEDVRGAVYLRTVSGELKPRRVDGNLVIQTSSGDAEGRRCTGQLGFKSVSGDLTLRDSTLTGCYLNTTSGDCSVEAQLRPGDYEIRSVSGDLDLAVQPDFAAAVTGRTVSGNFRSDFPVQYRDGGSAEWAEEGDGERGGPRVSAFGVNVGPEGVSMPGVEIGHGRVSLPGVEIGHGRVSIPGLDIDIRHDLDIDVESIEREARRAAREAERELRRARQEAERARRRERKRGRGRWDFVVGDPAAAEESKTRLRIRTVSGDVRIKRSRARDWPEPGTTGAADAATLARMTEEGTPARPPRPERPERPDRPARPEHRGAWPDTELWPAPPAHAAPAAAPAQPAQTQPAPATPAAPARPAAEAPERTRLEILQAVERKEISIEDAMKLLRELDGEK